MEITQDLKPTNRSEDQLQGSYLQDYTDFIDLASHELDAPFRKLNTLVTLMMERFEVLSQDEELRSYTARIDGSVADLRSMIDGMALLARIVPDKATITTCNAGKIIQRALQELEVPMKERKEIMSIFSLPVVEGNEEQLLLLFKNLIDNALKFTRAGTARQVTIRSAVLQEKDRIELDLPPGRTYHKIEIADNGIGFSKKDAEKIFLPFVRLHARSQFRGNGMGLAVARKVAVVHGGRLYAEGKENEGALFILLLPETC